HEVIVRAKRPGSRRRAGVAIPLNPVFRANVAVPPNQTGRRLAKRGPADGCAILASLGKKKQGGQKPSAWADAIRLD
ncbi:MAG: hypothetical protein QGF56_06140, partial [Verrucomicrobiota bacterium]|nr:hypothetical protein [Verrucomicrobiota bacterium]